MGKFCPKHVELILEINKTLIVASRWFLYYLKIFNFVSFKILYNVDFNL